MAKVFKTTLLITGDSKGGVKAVSATRSQIEALNRSFVKSRKDINAYNRTLTNSSKSLLGFSGNLKAALGIFSGAVFAREALRMADTAKQLTARLSLVTNGISDLNNVQERLQQISQNTFSSLETNVTLFSRMAIATQDLDISQEKLFRVTQSLQNSFRAYGTAGSEAASATLQLTQAMAKGKLDGDEFRSVMENAPLVMIALQEELGITKKELFEFSRSGKLSVEDLVNALSNSADEFAEKSAQIPRTIAESVTVLKNSLTVYIGDLDKSTGATTKLSDTIGLLADNIDVVVNIITTGVAIKLLSPTLNSIGKSALVAAVGVQKFGIGLTIVNAKAAALQGTLSILRGGMALLGGPVGVFALAAWGVYELIDSLETSNERIKELSILSENAQSAVNALNGEFSKGFNDTDIKTYTQSVKTLETELDILLEKQKELNAQRERENELLRNSAAGGKEALLFGFAAGQRGLSDAQIGNSAQIETIQSNLKIAQSYQKISDAISPIISVIGELSDMYNQSVDNIENNTQAINDWLLSADKQLAKITAKNQTFNKSTIEILKLDAVSKKALTTDAKQLALIDKITASLIKETTEYENKTKLKKRQAELAIEEIRLIQEYGTEIERIALLDKQHLENLAKYPELTELLIRKHIKQKEALSGVSGELTTQEGLWRDYIQLQRDLDIIDTTEERFLNLEIRIEDMASAMGLSESQIEIMREALLRLRLEADGTAGAINGVSNSSSLIAAGVFNGTFGSFFDGSSVTDTFINQLEGVFNNVIDGIGESIAEGFAENGASGAFEGLSSGISNVPVIAWIAMAMKINDGLFQQGWRASDGDVDLGGATAMMAFLGNSLLPTLIMASDNLLQSLGFSERIASLISGSSILVRLFGRKAPEVTGTGFSASVGAEGTSGQAYADVFREGGFFRSDQRYQEFAELTDEIIEQFNAIRDGILSSIAEIVEAIDSDYSGFVEGTLSQTFGADGELTGSTSEFFGVTREESADEFVQRLQIENIIAALGSILPEIEQFIESTFTLTDDVGNVLGEFTIITSEWVNELHVLAENYRDNLTDFAAFTEFAVLAITDIANDNGLLDSITAIHDITVELTQGNDSLAETYARLVIGLELTTQSFDLMGISLDLAQDEFIRFSDGIVTAAGGLAQAASLWQTYFSEFYSPDELRQQSIASSSELVGQQASNLGIDPDITESQFRQLFEAQLANGTLTEEQIVQWLELSSTLSNVNNLLDEQNQIEQERLQALQEYNDFALSISDQISRLESSDFANALADVRVEYDNNISTLNESAIAAGLAGASEEDLMQARRLASIQSLQIIQSLRNAIAALQEQLYGDDLEDRIAELEAAQLNGVDNVNTAVNGLYDSWVRVIDRLRDYTRDRLVGDLSPLEADERLNQAQIDFWDAYNRAQNGDLEAAQSLIGLANIVDQLNSAVNASGGDYNEIFFGIQDALNALEMPTGLTDNIIRGDFTVTPSAELRDLYEQLEARNAAGEARNRLELATQLAQHLAELALAVNQPLLDIADELGINMSDLISDLGINLDDITVASVESLANVARLLGINLSELTLSLSDDLSASFGLLADAQSLVNDGFENVISGLPEEYRDALEPLLRDVENAADGQAQVDAINALDALVLGLPIEYRNLLAPFLDNVNYASEITLLESTVDWLELIHGVLSNITPDELPPIIIDPPDPIGGMTSPGSPDEPPPDPIGGMTSPGDIDDPPPIIIPPPDLDPGPLNMPAYSRSTNNQSTKKLEDKISKLTLVVEKLTSDNKFNHVEKMQLQKDIANNTNKIKNNTKETVIIKRRNAL